MFARTKRLTLRPGWPEDAPALCAAIAHETVAMKLARLPWPYTLDHAQSWLATEHPSGEVSLVIVTHDATAPRLIGGIGLHATKTGGGTELEFGYWLTPAVWGRGYATEAGGAMIDIARHALGRQRLVSGHFVDNPASGRVLDKLGFARTGTEKRACLARGEELDCAVFERTL